MFGPPYLQVLNQILPAVGWISGCAQDMEGQLVYIILHKGLEYAQILVL